MLAVELRNGHRERNNVEAGSRGAHECSEKTRRYKGNARQSPYVTSEMRLCYGVIATSLNINLPRISTDDVIDETNIARFVCTFNAISQ